MDLPEHMWDALRENFETGISYDIYHYQKIVGSPIELMFLMAFKSEVFDGFNLVENGQDDLLVYNGMVIKPQYKIGQYSADFMIETFYDGKSFCRMVVECDGHEFHEKTKKQAEKDKIRDRHMTKNGFVVFRFTGREIYRDAMSCASEAINFCRSQRPRGN